MKQARADHKAIAELIPNGARVLDVGCGDGALLEHLVRDKHAQGRGLELNQQKVNACVARGLAVIQGDADTDLENYASQVFDYVILSQTIQATHHTKALLERLMRIGTHVAVSLPNFGHWKVRLDLLWRGRMPQTGLLNHPWYDTPNIHLCTIADFNALVTECGGVVEKAYALNQHGGVREIRSDSWLPNVLAESAVFLVRAFR